MSVTVALLLPVIIGWAAVAGYWYVALRRRRQREAAWKETASGLRELDRELDRVWANERLKRRR